MVQQVPLLKSFCVFEEEESGPLSRLDIQRESASRWRAVGHMRWASHMGASFGQPCLKSPRAVSECKIGAKVLQSEHGPESDGNVIVLWINTC